MDRQKLEEYDFDQDRLNEFVEEQNRCTLCGSQLHFNHETDYIHRTVKEEAGCPSCGVRIKTTNHLLH